MLNVGTGEIILIAVVALLVLGPKRLPELARGIGKFMREFRRQTDDVRNVVEREFYKMDHELDGEPPKVQPAQGAVAAESLPAPSLEPSQLTAGMSSAAAEVIGEGRPADPSQLEVAAALQGSSAPAVAVAPDAAPNASGDGLLSGKVG